MSLPHLRQLLQHAASGLELPPIDLALLHAGADKGGDPPLNVWIFRNWNGQIFNEVEPKSGDGSPESAGFDGANTDHGIQKCVGPQINTSTAVLEIERNCVWAEVLPCDAVVSDDAASEKVALAHLASPRDENLPPFDFMILGAWHRINTNNPPQWLCGEHVNLREKLYSVFRRTINPRKHGPVGASEIGEQSVQGHASELVFTRS